MSEYLKQYVQYVLNTGGNVDVAGFDDDWEPIGPRLRADLIPRYVTVNANGKLIVTGDGMRLLGKSP